MRLVCGLFAIALSLAARSAHATPADQCLDVFASARATLPAAQTLDKREHRKLIAQMKETLPDLAGATKLGPRIITNEARDIPDPERPLSVTLPNGQKKFVVGLSGQNILLVDKLRDLAQGGIKQVYKVELYNENGFQYGTEINPKTEIPYGSHQDSSTWDVAIVRVKNADGSESLKVLAGAMANDKDGKPLLVSRGHNHSRRRVIFDAEFKLKQNAAGEEEYILVATNPRDPLNTAKPKRGNWIETDKKGNITFQHGYGGGPVTLANGELYLDERGLVPFVYELVVEQRKIKDKRARKGYRHVPARTAIAVAYMDSQLSRVVVPPKIILDVYKPDGSVWAAAKRPVGPLVEGGHIEVRHNGRAVVSMEEVTRLRAAGEILDYQMLFSAGEYFSYYGSFMAYARGDLSKMKPVVNSAGGGGTGASGELYDITSQLKVLFTWLGRPVSFYDETGREYLMFHGVDRTSLPPGITLDIYPRKFKNVLHFNRQIIVVPVERFFEDGVEKLRMIDDTGVLEQLEGLKPRRAS